MNAFSTSLRNLFFLFPGIFLLAFPNASLAEGASSNTIPWSGYWWPHSEGGLVTGKDYRGSPSPLNKYDLYTSNLYEGPISKWYRQHFYKPNALEWEGHCLAWSKAAITEPSPILPSSENNILFRIGDKKGLLTLAHHNDLIARGGSSATAFHFWLLSYIKDQGKPFIADLGSSDEKWFYPVYKYDMSSTISGNIESVEVTIFYVSDAVHPDYLGTQTYFSTYTYNLVLDSGNSIIDGYWTGYSISDHPKALFYPLAIGNTSPLDYEIVRRLARSKDDFLENGAEPVDLAPGTFHLVLLDQDNYTLTPSPEDSFSLHIKKLSGSPEPLEISFAEGTPQEQHFTLATVNEEAVIQVDRTLLPSYTLRLSQADYRNPNLYTIHYDHRKWFTKRIPNLQRNSNWIGFALTNATTEPINNLTLTSYNDSGQPVHTLLGPRSLEPGKKEIFLFDDLPYRLHELRDTNGLLLTADNRVDFSALLGHEQLQLISENQEELPCSRIVFPQTFRGNIGSRFFVGNIFNETLKENTATITSYRSDGSVIDSTTYTFPEHGNLEFRPRNSNIPRMEDDGWLEIQSQQGSLSAFEYLVEEKGRDGIFGLPINKEIKYVPHIARPYPWNTRLTLYNGENSRNVVRLQPLSENATPVELVLEPKEKRELDLAATIAAPAGDTLPVIGISADHAFAGMVSYRNQATREQASLPLHTADNLGHLLVMPHLPNPEYWWCGIGIFNPANRTVPLVATPFSSSGEKLIDQQVHLTLAPGSYQVFSAASLFPAEIGNISHISFATENPEDHIGGFYLYGAKKGGTALSGAKM